MWNSKSTRASSPSSAWVSGSDAGRGAAVRLAGDVDGRALVVVAPLRLEVAVGIDTVRSIDRSVGVVVAQVLAPQPVAGLEGEVVAVGVGDGHEPQLGAVHQVGDRRVAAVAVHDVVGQPPVHLGGDPLAGVLGGGVQGGRAPAVAGLVGPARDLDGDDVLPVHRLADRHELDDVGVVGRDLLELLLEAAGAAVRSEDLVARGGLLRGQLGHRLAVDLLQLEVDALVGELRRLVLAQDDLDVGLAVGRRGDVHLVRVEPRRPHRGQVARVEPAGVDVVGGLALLLPGRGRRGGSGSRRGRSEPTDEHADGHDGRDPAPHPPYPRLFGKSRRKDARRRAACQRMHVQNGRGSAGGPRVLFNLRPAAGQSGRGHTTPPLD